MLGAICGDIIGSVHEFAPIKRTDFDLFVPGSRFTDDTVCTIAVADALLSGRGVEGRLVEWVLAHVDAGYGLHFLQWALSPERKPYNSWGNGAAMRVAAAAWLARDLGEAAEIAARTTAPTHDHHHGIRGAKAVAVAARMGLEGWSKDEIRAVVEDRFGYDLGRTPDEIRPAYRFEVACQRSVPEALCCFLAASSYEDAVRLAVSLGGDADTQACICGAVAEPFFGLPRAIAEEGLARLTPEMRAVVARFQEAVAPGRPRRSDPAAVARDLPPEREGPDPFADESVAREVRRIEAMEALLRAPARRAPSRFEVLLRRLAGSAPGGGVSARR